MSTGGSGQARQTTRTDDSSYEGEYPYVHVMETWAGHQIQHDDTPGKTRYFQRHSSGTYTEISHDGKKIDYNVGDTKGYNKGGSTSTTDENGDCKTCGHGRSVTGGGSHSETAGDSGGFSGGDVASVVMGAMNQRSKSHYNGTDEDHMTNVGGNKGSKVKGTHAMNAAKISMNGSAGQSSDERLKKDIHTIKGALDDVLKLRGVSYVWKDTEWLGKKKHYGFIAQEVEPIFPDIVSTNLEGMLQLDYVDLIGVLVEALRELKTSHDELQQEVALLKKRV